LLFIITEIQIITKDGILLYIFLLIGVTNKRVVEVCSGLGFENNAAFLITQFGFEGESFFYFLFSFLPFSFLFVKKKKKKQ